MTPTKSYVREHYPSSPLVTPERYSPRADARPRRPPRGILHLRDPPPRVVSVFLLDGRGAGGSPGRRAPRRVAAAPARVTMRGIRPAPARAYHPRGTDAALGPSSPMTRRSHFPCTCGSLAKTASVDKNGPFWVGPFALCVTEKPKPIRDLATLGLPIGKRELM